MIVLKKLSLTVAASTAGVFVGTVIATPPIAVMNYLATDGPLFPPPMLAFGLLAMPIGLMLLFVQAALVTYELLSKWLVAIALPAIAVICGSAAGLLWSFALDPRDPKPTFSLAIGLFGVVQALTVFGLHWIANKLGFATPRPRKASSPTFSGT